MSEATPGRQAIFDELLEALRPFAALKIDDAQPDDEFLFARGNAPIYVRDIRRARAVLAKAEGAK